MPSINYCVDLDARTRVRLNACEGEYTIGAQRRLLPNGNWHNTGEAVPTLNKSQAQALRDHLSCALED
jgi:hypothetical protein